MIARRALLLAVLGLPMLGCGDPRSPPCSTTDGALDVEGCTEGPGPGPEATHFEDGGTCDATCPEESPPLCPIAAGSDCEGEGFTLDACSAQGVACVEGGACCSGVCDTETCT